MPNMDGVKVLEAIRRVDTDVAVVIFTGYPSLETAVQSMKLDAVDYLKKPFNPEEFRAVVDRVMRKKGCCARPRTACIALSVKTYGRCAKRSRSRSSKWPGVLIFRSLCFRRSKELNRARRSVRCIRLPLRWMCVSKSSSGITRAPNRLKRLRFREVSGVRCGIRPDQGLRAPIRGGRNRR